MRRRGFTLLEVMVAIAILGLGLTTILSAQAGSFKAAHHARNLNVATGLVRCKMSELEEHLMRDGFQLIDEIESGPCCDGDSNAMIGCSWKIEQPVLPTAQLGSLDLASSLGTGDLGALGMLAPSGSSGSGFSPSGIASMDDLTKTLGSLNPQQSSSSLGSDGMLLDAGTAGLMAGRDDIAASGVSASPVGGIAQLLLGMIYPDLKTFFEASARRVTVTAVWREGGKENTLDVQQWFVSPQLPADDDSDAGATDTSSSSSTGGGRTPPK